MKKNFIIALLTSFFVLTNACAFNLVGAWKLIKVEENDKHHWVNACYSPQGLLIYTNTGYMSASLNCMQSVHSTHPNFSQRDTTFYAGTYTINADEVTHHVNYSSSSQYYGKHLMRKVQIITNNLMNLILNNSKGKMVKLTWQRVS